MGVGVIFSILVSILILSVLVLIVLFPEPIKPLISALVPNIEYQQNDNAKLIGKTTLYSNPTSNHDKLIVVFIGGCGLFSNRNNFYGMTNVMNELMGSNYDILLFEYPVRFKNTILETMLAINKILVDYIHYTTIHAVGVSFGSLLAGAFCQKEAFISKALAMKVPQIGMRFASLSAVSGVLDCSFSAQLMTSLFNFYIMRNTPGILNYTCYGLQIPRLVISATTDFLVAQTTRFIQNEVGQYKIYNSKNLPHAFIQYINLEEAIDAIGRIRDFILNIDSR